MALKYYAILVILFRMYDPYVFFNPFAGKAFQKQTPHLYRI